MSVAFNSFRAELCMSRQKKAFLSLIVLGLTATWLLVPSVLEYATRTSLAKLRSSDVPIYAENITGFVAGVSADTVSFSIPIKTGRKFPSHIPLLVPLRAVNASIQFNPLTSLLPFVHTRATLWEGSLNVILQKKEQATAVSGSFADIDLGRTPQFRSLGVSNGRVSGTLSELLIGRAGPIEGNADLTVSNLLIALDRFLPSIIEIEQLEISELKADIALTEAKKLKLNNFIARSNIGSVSGTGAATLSTNMAVNELSGNFKVLLNGARSIQIKKWLPLLTNGTIREDRESFTCSFQPVLCHLQPLSIHLSSSRCITARCQ